MTQTNDIVNRLENRAKLLDDEGLYVESNMNAEAAETIRVLRNEVQRLEQLTGMVSDQGGVLVVDGWLNQNYATNNGTSNSHPKYKITRFIV